MLHCDIFSLCSMLITGVQQCMFYSLNVCLYITFLYSNMVQKALYCWISLSKKYELEYLAVYGRACMAAFRQLSTHGQKFDLNPYMSLCNLKLCTHIWSTKFVPPKMLAKVHQIVFRGCYSTKPLTNPNFITVG